jgi:hypothetical protein
MGGFRIGAFVKLNKWVLIFAGIFILTFYLMWYTMIAVGWMLYGVLWLYYQIFRYCGKGIKWLCRAARGKLAPGSVEGAPRSDIPLSSDVGNAGYLHKTFKVAGVSFSNDNGTNRQSILRKIKFCDPPFDNGAELELRRYEYKGDPAYGIYANDMQIGNIASQDVPFVLDHWDKLVCFTAINVYGGGKSPEGEQRSFGAEVVLRFRP